MESGHIKSLVDVMMRSHESASSLRTDPQMPMQGRVGADLFRNANIVRCFVV